MLKDADCASGLTCILEVVEALEDETILDPYLDTFSTFAIDDDPDTEPGLGLYMLLIFSVPDDPENDTALKPMSGEVYAAVEQADTAPGRAKNIGIATENAND